MMRSPKLIAALALLGTPASAFWRMECRGVSGSARIDPLVSYGTVAGHVHEVFGGQGKCSAYWALNLSLQLTPNII